MGMGILRCMQCLECVSGFAMIVNDETKVEGVANIVSVVGIVVQEDVEVMLAQLNLFSRLPV